MHKHISRIVLTVFFAGAGTVVWGQKSSHVPSDAHFAVEAASGGMAEVKLGQLAQQNGSNDAVREFGKRMEIDHSKAGDQLKEIASKNNITLPTDLNNKDRATYDRLAKLSGTEFDRAYAQDMVTDHVQDIAAFKREANSGATPAIKDFASQTLPTLEDHLKHARGMEKSVSVQGPKSNQ